MSRFRSFILQLCVAVGVLFAGCEQLVEMPTEQPVMELDVYELYVTGSVGDVPIFYGIQNARPGVNPEVRSGVEWVSVKEVANGTIMLYVEPSDIDEERLGFIFIDYEGMEKSLKVSIVQSKQVYDFFKFEVVESTHTTCTVKYIPKQNGKMYMANVIDSAYFAQSGIYDMNQFIELEMANYLNIAAQHEMKLEYLLTEAVNPQMLFTEEATRSFANMQPGATYVVYAYGVEFDGDNYSVTIPCQTLSVTLPNSQYYDAVFTVSPQVSNSGLASVAVTPKNWSGYYAVSVIPDSSVYYIPKGERMSEATLKAMSNDFYKRARQAIQDGASVEGYLKSSCFTGSQMFSISLSGGSKYMVAVYAVESINGAIPVMCSIPTIAYF